MKLRIILVLLSITSAISCKKDYSYIYYDNDQINMIVLDNLGKNQRRLENGVWEVNVGNEKYCSGNFSMGQKVGLWTYYSTDTMKINWSNLTFNNLHVNIPKGWLINKDTQYFFEALIKSSEGEVDSENYVIVLEKEMDFSEYIKVYQAGVDSFNPGYHLVNRSDLKSDIYVFFQTITAADVHKRNTASAIVRFKDKTYDITISTTPNFASEEKSRLLLLEILKSMQIGGSYMLPALDRWEIKKLKY